MASLTGLISNFTPVASRYDGTRNIPDEILGRCYAVLAEERILPPGGEILDVGCGTGQISIPLASRGYRVVGIDVSDAMVEIAAAKVREGWAARYETGDVRSLAYADGTFDGVVFSKLMMHIEDWRSACRELIRVTKPGLCIVEIKDRGFFANSVRIEFSRRADEQGHKGRFLGAQPSSNSVPDWMRSLGCESERLNVEATTWCHEVTRLEALRGFAERLFAEFWYMPLPIYDRVLNETYDWAAQQPGGLDEPEYLTPYLDVDIYRTPA